jgi:bifunctional DNA-binding transcriptional regulator/antitoxin component of YhaV-PrlF toxin-antitoxin module
MPQLAKGGKYVFGWSRVQRQGRIIIPPEAFKEYGFQSGENTFLMSGSKTSGGFSITSARLLEGSPISEFLDDLPQLVDPVKNQGTTIEHKKRLYSRVKMKKGFIVIPFDTLAKYGVEAGCLLLCVRGSGLALGFLSKGPLHRLAQKHPSIAVF